MSRWDSYFLLPSLMEQATHGFDVFNTNHNCCCEYCKSYRDSVQRLVDSFSSIPTRWLQRIDEDLLWTPMWGTVFMPTNSVDIRNIEELLAPISDDPSVAPSGWDKVGDTGIIVIQCDDELILGIDGAGYDFYTDHWIKLYDALGYEWHTPVPDA
ncbi:hypothetical protein [Thalassoglobus neptunius]|nr:hypothetical protein [Thalassoglobus neptunius]